MLKDVEKAVDMAIVRREAIGIRVRVTLCRTLTLTQGARLCHTCTQHHFARKAIEKRAAEKSDPNFMGRIEIQIKCVRNGCNTYRKVRVTKASLCHPAPAKASSHAMVVHKAERQRIGAERASCMSFYCSRCCVQEKAAMSPNEPRIPS